MGLLQKERKVTRHVTLTTGLPWRQGAVRLRAQAPPRRLRLDFVVFGAL